ncbi:class I SAM-dependent methyltransferase [Crocinitomicaceae bacterium]|nr:class I SAM-dependent methyltransferase [Crocinitomicaceae bacterium]
MSEINLGKLGFYWRMTDALNVPQNPVPDFVDFSFEFDEAHQLIIQKKNDQTWEYLETIYNENYNVGYLQEGHDLALSYGDDFLNFIEHTISSYNSNVKRVFEIGAGGCYILDRLKQKGLDVVAIDPSPIAAKAGNKYGIEVQNEFYPTKEKIEPSDLIIHYDVLEHVLDPWDFLRMHKNDLTEGGLILFAVPDCSHYIPVGDISMILHEHINYYDQESLRNVVESAGFEVLEIKAAEYGGVLYCTAKVAKEETWVPKVGREKAIKFENDITQLKDKVTAFILEGTQEGNTLGCYIPLRMVPYLSICGVNSNIRFFDDNTGIHHQYFDGFDAKVENMDELVEKPVTHLIIMSAIFGEIIKTKVMDRTVGSGMQIKCLNDFF